MKDLLEKLPSYNLFNYLLPGTVFSVLADRFTRYPFVYDDLFIAFFAYYFTGLVISRIGSLALEPFLRRTHFVVFASYAEFLRCSAKDPKLEVLSEANNSYRTLATVFLAIGVLVLTDIVLKEMSAPAWVAPAALSVFLFTLFLLAYRKQTAYITKRIDSQKDAP